MDSVARKTALSASVPSTSLATIEVLQNIETDSLPSSVLASTASKTVEIILNIKQTEKLHTSVLPSSVPTMAEDASQNIKQPENSSSFALVSSVFTTVAVIKQAEKPSTSALMSSVFTTVAETDQLEDGGDCRPMSSRYCNVRTAETGAPSRKLVFTEVTSHDQVRKSFIEATTTTTSQREHSSAMSSSLTPVEFHMEELLNPLSKTFGNIEYVSSAMTAPSNLYKTLLSIASETTANQAISQSQYSQWLSTAVTLKDSSMTGIEMLARSTSNEPESSNEVFSLGKSSSPNKEEPQVSTGAALKSNFFQTTARYGASSAVATDTINAGSLATTETPNLTKTLLSMKEGTSSSTAETKLIRTSSSKPAAHVTASISSLEYIPFFLYLSTSVVSALDSSMKVDEETPITTVEAISKGSHCSTTLYSKSSDSSPLTNSSAAISYEEVASVSTAVAIPVTELPNASEIQPSTIFATTGSISSFTMVSLSEKKLSTAESHSIVTGASSSILASSTVSNDGSSCKFLHLISMVL